MNSQVSGNTSLRAWIIPILYLLAVVIIGVALAPLLHWLLPEMMPLTRSLHRGLQIAAVALALPYLIRNWKNLGLNWNLAALKHFGFGVAVGAGMLILMAVILLATGLRQWGESPSMAAVLKFFLSAAAVGVAEEILFRGFVQRYLISISSTAIGLIIASIFFAAVHFVQVPPQLNTQPVTLATSTNAFLTALYRMCTASFRVGQGPTLLLLGLILGILYVRSNSLWTPIGAHFSVVLTLKYWSYASKNPDFTPAINPLFTDLLTASILLFILFLLWHYYRPAKSSRGGIHSST